MYCGLLKMQFVLRLCVDVSIFQFLRRQSYGSPEALHFPPVRPSVRACVPVEAFSGLAVEFYSLNLFF